MFGAPGTVVWVLSTRPSHWQKAVCTLTFQEALPGLKPPGAPPGGLDVALPGHRLQDPTAITCTGSHVASHPPTPRPCMQKGGTQNPGLAPAVGSMVRALARAPKDHVFDSWPKACT